MLGTLVVGVSHSGIKQRAPPIIGRAAITLGIGPHCSFDFVFSVLAKILAGKSLFEMTYFVLSVM